MSITYKDLTLGDPVFFNDRNKGWKPAFIVTIYPLQTGQSAPDLDLLIAVPGFHSGTFSKERVSHGKEIDHWMHRKQVLAMEEEPEKAMSDVQVQHLAALKALEAQILALKAQAPPKPAEPPKEQEPKPKTAKK
jgi:hypothetical protein